MVSITGRLRETQDALEAFAVGGRTLTGRQLKDEMLAAMRSKAAGDAAPFNHLYRPEQDGLATYAVDGDSAELVTLDAVRPACGVGTALLEALAGRLGALGARTLVVTTTNDNLDALRFYQRRGFHLACLRAGALEGSRRLRPQIPATGAYGIPLRDEIELSRTLA